VGSSQDVVLALAWSVALPVVVAPIAVYRYRRVGLVMSIDEPPDRVNEVKSERLLSVSRGLAPPGGV
jgi:hypothetical protein